MPYENGIKASYDDNDNMYIFSCKRCGYTVQAHSPGGVRAMWQISNNPAPKFKKLWIEEYNEQNNNKNPLDKIARLKLLAKKRRTRSAGKKA